MNKTDLTKIVSQKTGLTQKTTAGVINALCESIAQALVDGKPVRISGFGTFNVKTRAARLGYNPKTAQYSKVEAYKVPAFKPSDTLRGKIKA